METGIAQAGPPPPATGWPRSGADGGKLAASRFADANPVNAGKPERLLIVPAADPAGNCPSR